MGEKVTEDGQTRLINTIYTGYVNNRNKEIDRIDNSTGWSIGILVLMLSFMITSDIPYYFIPFTFIILLPFWIKESRRYVYYLYWSFMESEIKDQISSSIEKKQMNNKIFSKIIDFKQPDKIIDIYKAFKVRFFRSYYWFTLLIYFTTLIQAIQQQAIFNHTQTQGIIFILILTTLICLGFKNHDEMIMPRKVIMQPGIKQS
jgi:uncharacterized membrane protein